MFRSLDPQLGRFWQIDPLAEETSDVSPYAFVGNNPLMFIDPMGLEDSLPYAGATVTVTSDPPWWTFLNGGRSDTYTGVDLLKKPRGLQSIPGLDGTYNQLGDVVVSDKAKPKPARVHLLIWDAGSGKDVGHTAIVIDNMTYGYYPTDENNNGQFDMGELLHSKGRMHMDTEAKFLELYNGDAITSYDVNMTPAQINQLSNILNDYAKNPGNYSLVGNNCTSVAVNALLNSGITIMYQGPTIGQDRVSDGYLMSPSDLNSVVQVPDNQNTFYNQQHYTIK